MISLQLWCLWLPFILGFLLLALAFPVKMFRRTLIAVGLSFVVFGLLLLFYPGFHFQ